MLGYLDDRARPRPPSTPTAGCTLATSVLSTRPATCEITDRLKDMYICGGFNVYPAEIEQVLARMQGVADAAVIGCPTSDWAKWAGRSWWPGPVRRSTKRR